MIPALPEVQAYRDRILTVIRRVEDDDEAEWARCAADRRRIGRDVEGLRLALACIAEGLPWQDDHALRYWTDLTEVGSLYGQPWITA